MLSRKWWTAERFGVTPRKLVARVTHTGLPRVLCVSLPKAGTHLVERAVCLHPGMRRRILPTLNPENVGLRGLEGILKKLRAGQVVLAHLPFDTVYPPVLEQEGVRALFVIRDPRDIAVSLAHYIESRGDHPLRSAYSERPDERSRIELAILGDAEVEPPAPSLEGLLAGFSGWLESGALVVRFEDLIGERGGADPAAQARTVDEIYAHLGLEQPEGVAGRLFSASSPTFRAGQVGQWRTAFDPELVALFGRAAAGWMKVYGYR